MFSVTIAVYSDTYLTEIPETWKRKNFKCQFCTLKWKVSLKEQKSIRVYFIFFIVKMTRSLFALTLIVKITK